MVPVLVATCTTNIVLAPLALMPGMGGFLFRPLALAVTFAMFSSFLLSRTFVPMMCAKFLPDEHRTHRRAPGMSGRRRCPDIGAPRPGEHPEPGFFGGSITASTDAIDRGQRRVVRASARAGPAASLQAARVRGRSDPGRGGPGPAHRPRILPAGRRRADHHVPALVRRTCGSTPARSASPRSRTSSARTSPRTSWR